MKKTFVTAAQLLEDSFKLAADIVDSGYRPSLLIGVWRGGAPVAIAVHEVLALCGNHCDHIAVKCKSYSGIDQQEAQIEIQDLQYLVGTLSEHDQILIVDDVHDTGRSMQALISEITAIRHSAEIKVACAYFKPQRNLVDFAPDYYVSESDQWLVFPHELQGLSAQELANEKPETGRLKQWLSERAN